MQRKGKLRSKVILFKMKTALSYPNINDPMYNMDVLLLSSSYFIQHGRYSSPSYFLGGGIFDLHVCRIGSNPTPVHFQSSPRILGYFFLFSYSLISDQ